MTNAQAYQILTNPMVGFGVSSLPGIPAGSEINEAISMSAAALRSQVDAEKTAPLTLDELWNMPGKAVWVHPVAWALVRRVVDPVSKEEASRIKRTPAADAYTFATLSNRAITC